MNDHERSVRAVMAANAKPRDLGGYLAWFLRAWADELPDRLHSAGVWRDYGKDAVGGSALGSPRLNDAFRAYIEGSPYQTDHDPRLDTDERDAVYLRPLHRVLHRMTANQYGPLTAKTGVRPYMARYLFALACSGGDWTRIAPRFGIAPQAAPLYTERALERLWTEYERAPEARAVA